MIVLFFGCLTVVSASDSNLTDVVDISADDSFELDEVDAATGDVPQEDVSDASIVVNKTTPEISIKTNKVKTKDTLEFYLKNVTDSPIKYKILNVTLNKNKYSIKTDSKGVAKLNIDLPSNIYKLTISFDGDEQYNSTSQNFNIKVYKLKTNIFPLSNFVIKKDYLNFYLYDQNWNGVSGKKIAFKLNGKKYVRTTDKYGLIKFKISLNPSKYAIYAKFGGDNQFKASSKTLKFYVVSSLSFKIENSKLLTKGWIRVYFTGPGDINKKTISLKIGDKIFSKKTNSEGVVLFKPKMVANTYKVTVKMGKYQLWKKLKCYNGDLKDPLKENIPLKNGRPDIDVMPGTYVTANENGKFTLTRAQYREVLQRDSFCMFLNNKLTYYTFFKTKYHPNIYHILKREKWNVIEREINKKLVSTNKPGYWPSEITASLKGKSYTYPIIRDVQDTRYTCGPTSGSVCSQVLKSYVCEKQLAKQSGTTKIGTPCDKIKKGLEKNYFTCTLFYKASFKNALNELKKGGAALIFHANNHYVTIIDISSDGKWVLVSNSYGSYDNIPTGWLKVSYMKNKFSHWEESLIVKLKYKLSDSTKNSVNCYYNSMGTNWQKHNTHQTIGSAF